MAQFQCQWRERRGGHRRTVHSALPLIFSLQLKFEWTTVEQQSKVFVVRGSQTKTLMCFELSILMIRGYRVAMDSRWPFVKRKCKHPRDLHRPWRNVHQQKALWKLIEKETLEIATAGRDKVEADVTQCVTWWRGKECNYGEYGLLMADLHDEVDGLVWSTFGLLAARLMAWKSFVRCVTSAKVAEHATVFFLINFSRKYFP